MSADETAFVRGELGVDGRPTDESEDPGDRERRKALEALTRGRTWLGRELLTWLLWRSNSGAPLADLEGEDVFVVFVGPVVLQGLAGDATELRAKGFQSAYAEIVREALGRGLLLHQARLRLRHGERVFEATIDAEHLSLRSVRIPRLLTEEDDQRLEERLHLVDHLGRLIDALWSAFVAVRSEPEWEEREVPGLRAWLEEG